MNFEDERLADFAFKGFAVEALKAVRLRAVLRLSGVRFNGLQGDPHLDLIRSNAIQ